MKSIKNLIAVSAFSLVVLALPSVASAQWFPNSGPGVYRGGQVRDLRGVARSLKQRSRDFERQVDRMDRNRGYRGNRGNYGRNDQDLRRLANDFRRAADNFQSRYGNGRNLNNSADAARRLLDSASRLDNALRYARVRNLHGQFNQMRGELNMVAQTYGYRYDNRGGNQRGNPGGIFNGRLPWPF
ncbi:MAG: hypothetical protein H0V76_08070 [Blastocatellia bacterium]|nr:hypothetical protein [Blastocatellia bacterium]